MVSIGARVLELACEPENQGAVLRCSRPTLISGLRSSRVNPHPPIAPPAADRSKKESTPLKLHRPTLALAPALAERLAKEKWKLRPASHDEKCSEEGENRV